MKALVDTSVLIDFLRGSVVAAEIIETEHRQARLEASEITRLEVLAGMRPHEEPATQSLLSVLVWHPVDTDISERAGELGRQWLPSHHTIDGADLAIAATADVHGLRLLTRNVKHFPMFAGLASPY